MIVWVASFPRSGNTAFRILLHHLYGVPTYAGVDGNEGDDLRDVDAGYLTGYRELPRTLRDASRRNEQDVRRILDELEQQDEVFFIKTHRATDELYNNNYRTILLVRDGRDAVVSFARYLIDVHYGWVRFRRQCLWLMLRFWRPSAWSYVLTFTTISAIKLIGGKEKLFRHILRKCIAANRWSYVTNSWMNRSQGITQVVRFEDLISHPIACVRTTLYGMDVRLPETGNDIPTFAQLKQVYPSFFRSGRTGDWRQEFSDDLVKVFWEVHGETMERLGYLKEPG